MAMVVFCPGDNADKHAGSLLRLDAHREWWAPRPLPVPPPAPTPSTKAAVVHTTQPRLPSASCRWHSCQLPQFIRSRRWLTWGHIPEIAPQGPSESAFCPRRPHLPCSLAPTFPLAPFSPARSSQAEWRGTICAAWLYSREGRRISRGGTPPLLWSPLTFQMPAWPQLRSCDNTDFAPNLLRGHCHAESCGPGWRFRREWGWSWTSASDLPRGADCWGKSPRSSSYYRLPSLPASCP